MNKDDTLRKELVNIARENTKRYKKLNSSTPKRVVKHNKNQSVSKSLLFQTIVALLVCGAIALYNIEFKDPDVIVDHTGYIMRVDNNNVGRGK